MKFYGFMLREVYDFHIYINLLKKWMVFGRIINNKNIVNWFVIIKIIILGNIWLFKWRLYMKYTSSFDIDSEVMPIFCDGNKTAIRQTGFQLTADILFGYDL